MLEEVGRRGTGNGQSGSRRKNSSQSGSKGLSQEGERGGILRVQSL